MKTCIARWVVSCVVLSCLSPSFAAYHSCENGEWAELALIPESDPPSYWYHVWHSGTIPGAGDTVTITNSVSSSNSLTVETWNMVSGDLALTGGSTFTPTSGGTWYGGTFLGSLENSSTILLSGSDLKRVRNYGLVDNHGTFRQTDGEFSIWGNVNTAYFYNYADGVYDIEADGTNITAASGYFVQRGRLEKSAGSGTSYITAPILGCGGTVDVQVGTLVLAGGGILSNGTLNVASGSALDLTGGGNPALDGTFTGHGLGHVGWSSGKIGYNEHGMSATLQFTNGLYWSGGAFQGYLRNDELFWIDGTATKEDYISTFDNYGTVRQTNTGPLYLNKFNNTCYFQNRAGALYDILGDGTNITCSSGDDADDAFYNYGTLRKSGGDGTSILAAAFCNVGGTVDVRRGTLVLAGGGTSTNGGSFNVAEGAVLDLTGGQSPRYVGTFTGTGGGVVTWRSGSLDPNTSATFNFTNGLVWAGGRFWAYIRNDGLMTLDGTGTKEDFISTFDNYGTVRQTNTGALYLNKFNNTCYFQNRAGALYDILGDGTNITCSSGDDADDAFYNYGTLRKSGGDGTSILAAAFCNVGGTVDVRRGTLVLAGGGTSTNGGSFNVAEGAVLDLTGGQSPRYVGTFTGTGGGVVTWRSGSLDPNTSATFNFTNGLVWAGGRFWAYIRNDGLMTLDGTGTKEDFISTFDNYGTVRQTNTGALYLNKFNNTCYFQNRAGALYDIQSDGTNITCSSGDDTTDAFYNYGTLRKSGGDGTSILAAAFCSVGGTVDVQRGTLVLAGGGVYSNGSFRAAAGATLDLAGSGSPIWYGTLSGGGEGAIQWSGGWIGDGSSATLSFTNGLHWTGGTLRGYLANAGVIYLEGAATKTPEYYSTLDNFGTIYAREGGPLRLCGSPNTAILNNQAGALFQIDCDGTNISGCTTSGRFNNYGSFAKASGTGVSLVQCSFYQYGGTVDVRRGTQQFVDYTQTGGVLRLSGGNVILPSYPTFQGGQIAGTGTISLTTLASSSRIAPGFSAGTLTISGGYSQAASGVLDLEIGGTAPGSEYDQLCITGAATLGGTANVSLINGFVPAFGQSFTLLTRGSGSGTFTNLNLPALSGGLLWRPRYTNTSFSIEVVGSVQFDAATATVAENGGAVTVRVSRAGSSSGALSVPFGTYSGSARAGYEFVGATGTVDFADGSTSAVLAVTILDNAWRDLNTDFSIRLGAPTGSWQLASPSNVTVQIVDDEVLSPVAALPFSEPFSSDSQAAWWTWYMTGAGRILLTTNYTPSSPDWHMTMDGASNALSSLNEALLSVHLAGRSNVWLRFRHKEFSDSDNTMPASFVDHTNADGVAISPDGTNWIRVQGLTSADSISSSYRPFTVALDGFLGVTNYTADTRIKFQQFGLYPINSAGFAFDDIELFESSGTIQLATNALTAAENSGTVTVLVQRTSGVGTAAVAYVTANATARSGFDYVGATGVVSFSAGVTSRPITVALLDNHFANDSRTFQIQLTEVGGTFVAGSPTGAVVTLTDNEVLKAAGIPFYDGFETGNPSNSWFVYSTAAGQVQVTNSEGPRGSWHLTMDSAVSNTWSLNEAVLTVNLAGQTNVWLSFFEKEFNDTDHAMATTFTGHAYVDGVAISTNGTNWIRLASLTGAASTTNYTQYFISIDSAVTNLLAYATNTQIKFQQYDRYPLGSAGFAFDDIRVFKPQGYVQLATNAYTVAENGNSVTVRVTRSNTSGALPVHLSALDGSARGGYEYRATNAAVTFASGAAGTGLVVSVINNTRVNPDSVFTVAVDEVNGWFVPSNPASASVTITNDEASTSAGLPFHDGFEAGSFSNCWSLFSSGQGRMSNSTSGGPYAGSRHLTMDSAVSNTWSLNEAVLSVNLAGRTNVWLGYHQREFPDSDQGMSATFSGHAGVDGIAISTNGTNWYRVISLTGAASSTNDQYGLYSLSAIAASNGLTFGARVLIKFQEYGAAPVPDGGFALDEVSVFESSGSIQLASMYFYARESDGAATITVSRTSSTGTMSVSYYTTDGSASNGIDYTTVTGVLTFAVGELQKVFTVPVMSDRLVEGTEWFAVGVKDCVGGTPGSPSAAGVVLYDHESRDSLVADFSSGLPAGWTITTNGNTNAYWRFDDPGVRGNLTGGFGTFAMADSDLAGSGILMDTELRSPILAFTNVATACLTFRYDFRYYANGTGDVDVSTSGAAGPWTTIWRRCGASARGPAQAKVNISSLVREQTNVMIRFHYIGTYDYWWEVDDVDAYGEPDADGDGAPDWWEEIYSGTATGLVGSADDDGDYVNNTCEFFSGTDPTNGASFLGLRNMSATVTGVVVRWSSETNRSYRLERSSNLLWGFTSVLLTNIAATPPTNSVTVTNAPVENGWYRIGVE